MPDCQHDFIGIVKGVECKKCGLFMLTQNYVACLRGVNPPQEVTRKKPAKKAVEK